ncbi:hypothetical protein I317_05990 [Kwoniella heveanensis CBS 569]|nr:hypothetical protein I317_05990 [Kwoniella heveanensis CBS 569]
MSTQPFFVARSATWPSMATATTGGLSGSSVYDLDDISEEGDDETTSPEASVGVGSEQSWIIPHRPRAAPSWHDASAGDPMTGVQSSNAPGTAVPTSGATSSVALLFTTHTIYPGSSSIRPSYKVRPTFDPGTVPTAEDLDRAVSFAREFTGSWKGFNVRTLDTSISFDRPDHPAQFLDNAEGTGPIDLEGLIRTSSQALVETLADPIMSRQGVPYLLVNHDRFTAAHPAIYMHGSLQQPEAFDSAFVERWNKNWVDRRPE